MSDPEVPERAAIAHELASVHLRRVTMSRVSRPNPLIIGSGNDERERSGVSFAKSRFREMLQALHGRVYMPQLGGASP